MPGRGDGVPDTIEPDTKLQTPQVVDLAEDLARYLVCGLVAHRSGARFVARVRGLEDQLSEFVFEVDALSDAVTVADQTAGPNGVPKTVPERMEDMLARHGPDSPNARAHAERRPYLLSASERVIDRLDRAGIGPERHHIF